MSRAKKKRQATIPRDEDFAKWRQLCNKNVIAQDFDKYGRKLYGCSQESKRVYMASANQSLHVRSFVKLRPLLEEQRVMNGGNGELPLLECCADGQTLRFARDPDITEDEEMEAQEAAEHDNIPGATKFMHAFNSARLADHTVDQQRTFASFMPSVLDIIMYGGQSCLVVYGERGSGKSYNLFGRDVDGDYSDAERRSDDAQSEQVESENSNDISSTPATNSSISPSITSVLNKKEMQRDAEEEKEEEEEEEEEKQKDLRWLRVEDNGEATGLMQRSISYLFDKIYQGRKERQSRYKIEMQCLASAEGSEVVYDMLRQDQNGRPVECLVQWEPSAEKFEALGGEFLTFRSRKNMIYAALRSNFLVDYLGMGKCTLVYKFRVEICGTGDDDWKDIVGDQLDEGQPRIGEFTLIKVAGFEIEEGYPDDHGKDGIFKHSETLRFIVETLEKQNYNNLPALRKKTVVPYRNNSVTKLMAPCLKPGSIIVFLGTVGIDKDSHVGTLHTLWVASCINKPRSHKVSFKRALNKLKVVNLFSKVGSNWQSRSPEEREKRKIQLKAHVFAAKQANLHHILSDQHMLKSGNNEWSADHQTQLERAMPRLDKRVARAMITDTSEAEVFKRTKSSKNSEMPVIDEEENEEELIDKSTFRFKRTRRPLNRNTGGVIRNDLLTPALGVLKLDKIVYIPPGPRVSK